MGAAEVGPDLLFQLLFFLVIFYDLELVAPPYCFAVSPVLVPQNRTTSEVRQMSLCLAYLLHCTSSI